MKNTLLDKRLKTLTAFRVLFVTILLGSIFVFEIGYNIFPYQRGILYLIVSLYALTIIYSLALRKGGSMVLAYVQLTIDVISAVMLVYFTGGIESWFSSMMLIIVIASSIVAGRNAGYSMAILSSILYGSLIDLQYYGLLPLPFDPMLLEKDFLYNIFSHLLALYLTAYLTGYLTSGLEGVTIRLREKDFDLRTLARFNRDVIDSMPTGLFTTDTNGKILLFNRAAQLITGISPGLAVGRHMRDIFPFVIEIAGKKRFEGFIELHGSERAIDLSLSEMRDEDARAKGFIGIFEDLTDIRAMQEQVRQKEKLAAIGELSANMAHEIRNPLASLRGSVEMLRDGSVSVKHKEKLMDIALGEMDRLNRIITDFLSYSRPRPIELREFDLHQVIEETTEFLKNRNQCEVVFVRASDGPLTAQGDPLRLQQVFWNLGNNALDAMPGGGTLTITIRDGVDHVEVAFKDTGSGINHEDIAKVFYPFFTTKAEGTGLGLSIAYRIMQDHGGTITADSQQGFGSVFTVLLPGSAHGP